MLSWKRMEQLRVEKKIFFLPEGTPTKDYIVYSSITLAWSPTTSSNFNKMTYYGTFFGPPFMIKTHTKTFAATYLQLIYLRTLDLEKHLAKCFENSAVNFDTSKLYNLVRLQQTITNNYSLTITSRNYSTNANN